MIIEERDYRTKAGQTAAFVASYGQYGLPLQLKYLGTFHGYFTSEIGELNHVVAWWSYDSLDDRAARRARMQADPEWSGYLRRIDGMLDLQTNRILKPASFSPLGGDGKPAG